MEGEQNILTSFVEAANSSTKAKIVTFYERQFSFLEVRLYVGP